MTKKENVEELLISLDNEISYRNKGLQMIESDYPSRDGKIVASQYPEYKKRKEEVYQRFEHRWISLLSTLDGLCKKIRTKQPDLYELSSENLNIDRSFPRNIVLGRIHARYENLDIYVPRAIEFPIKNAVYINDDEHNNLIHSLLLRLLFALPTNKIEFTIFDPNGLGSAVDIFRRLYGIESIFPHKKVLSTQQELKKMLVSALEYCEELIQKTFTKESNCWADYNRLKFSQGDEIRKQMLPYKVFAFFNVPSGFDTECFDMFRKLAKNGERLGILVIFSYSPSALEKDKSYQNSLVDGLQQFISEDAVSLYNIVNVLSKSVNVDHLKLTEISERLPNNNKIDELLTHFIHALGDMQNDSVSFDGLIDASNLFNDTSIKSVSIPLGFAFPNGGITQFKLGDDPPHALIGGTTGSGKSNLLHVLILSACCRFSPDELNVYLLDFKEGVEFSVYAAQRLPHARLVATEADTEYGISVLQHLVEENNSRYKLFKKAGVNNIADYRKSNTDVKLPRLMLIIDEFQVLFSGSSNVKAQEYFSTLAKQGRACGIHIVMATQTLSGLDFNALGTQFGGRIALKCSEDDSKKLLGGLNNDAATQISIPYAILNTSSGAVSANIKFAVPFAEPQKVRETIQLLKCKCSGKHYAFETKVFEGMTLPQFPSDKEYVNSKSHLLLGEVLSYSSDKFDIELKEKPYYNLLICGNDEVITQGLLISTLRSAEFSDGIKEIIYVGCRLNDQYGVYSKLIKFESLTNFLEEYKDKLFDNKKLIIFDIVNAVKEINYPTTTYPGQQLTESQKALKTLLDACNICGSYIVAFYDKVSQMKTSGISLDRFDLRVGYLLNDSDTGVLLGQHLTSISKETKMGRAFFANNGEILNWFKPYVGERDD